jgi:hypothetical protein
VKPIKMFGLAALAALMAMAFAGASSAMAEETTLCSNDSTSSCSVVTHVHETTLAGSSNQATLLSSVINVKCDVLFLGDTLGEQGSPLLIHGHFTYSGCNNSCVVTEESASSLIEVKKTSHETAKVTGNGEVRVHCGFFINCVYNGTGLEGTSRGPLLALTEKTNGETTLSGQETNRVSGFCPEEAFLDITTTPLSATYVKGMTCEPLAHGLYLLQVTTSLCSSHKTGEGEFELYWR